MNSEKPTSQAMQLLLGTRAWIFSPVAIALLADEFECSPEDACILLQNALQDGIRARGPDKALIEIDVWRFALPHPTGGATSFPPHQTVRSFQVNRSELLEFMAALRESSHTEPPTSDQIESKAAVATLKGRQALEQVARNVLVGTPRGQAKPFLPPSKRGRKAGVMVQTAKRMVADVEAGRTNIEKLLEQKQDSLKEMYGVKNRSTARKALDHAAEKIAKKRISDDS
jgi:hypothetical protein